MSERQQIINILSEAFRKNQHTKDNAQQLLFKREDNIHKLERELHSVKKAAHDLQHAKDTSNQWTPVKEQWLQRAVALTSHLACQIKKEEAELSQLQKELDAIPTPDFMLTLMQQLSKGDNNEQS